MKELLDIVLSRCDEPRMLHLHTDIIRPRHAHLNEIILINNVIPAKLTFPDSLLLKAYFYQDLPVTPSNLNVLTTILIDAVQ